MIDIPGIRIWASEQTSVVELTDAAAVLDKVVYGVLNPVEADLVVCVDDWPGAKSWGRALDAKKLKLRRPDWYFSKHGPMPETVEFRFEVPPAYADMSREKWAALVRKHVREGERAAAKRRREEGKTVLGRRAVMKQSPFSSPATSNPRGALSPRVAGRNRWRRVEVLQRNRDWLAAYRDAYVRLKRGMKQVLYPAGTYQLVQRSLVAAMPP